MLDLIRANAQSWGVKIAFGIIILVFVFWGVGGLTGGPSTVILTVNGEPITIQEFQRKYEQLEQQVRAQYPDLDAAGLKAMQLKQQLIQNLILENLIMQEAKRVGIVVTPVELRKLIESFPAFHNAEGKFDPDAYVRVIKAQRNTPGNFEAELRNNMLMNKLRADVTAGAFVPEAEVRDLFRYEGERRILEYVFYPLEDYTSKVTVDDAQIKDYYEANQASFTVPPQADVEYLLIGAEALAEVLPFPNKVAVVYMTGAQLLETLEAASQGLPYTAETADTCASLMQVSGLTYTVDTTKAYDALEAYGDHWFTAGSVSRVRIDDVNGQPFDAEATYAVVTSNANFNGMDSSYVLKAAAEANEQSAVTTAVVRDVVFRFIAAELNHQVGEAYAAPQGRLTVL